MTGICPIVIDSLSAEQKKVMYQRHSLIVPILPYLSDERKRSNLIRTISIERKISKQTILKYQCRILKNGQEQVEYIQTGLIIFTKVLEAYLTAIANERLFSDNEY